jgi:hypothetical protein
MTEELKTTYNGIEISYTEYDNKWKATENSRSYESLAKVKEAIDRATKVSKKMAPMACIMQKSYGGSGDAEFKKATITSFVDENHAWVTFLDKKGNKVREKCSTESFRKADLYADTPENWAVIDKLNSLWKKERELEGEIEAVYDKMKGINVAAEYKRLIAEIGDKEEAEK